MSDRVIASRPSLEQVAAIVDFMEKHPALGQGQLRGLEGREESKKLWFKLTRIINDTPGPNRPMKSWIKYWADKKSTVRAKVQSSGGDPNNLCSNVEKKIWDLFLANDSGKPRVAKLKQETSFLDDGYYNEEGDDADHHEDGEHDVPMAGRAPDRQTILMEKLVKVMSDQAGALSQLAHATHVNAQALSRLADASQLQARAVDRLATTFESISSNTHDVRNAIVEIDVTMKRFYNPSPT